MSAALRQEPVSRVEYDAAGLFCSEGFQMGGLLVPRNEHHTAALNFLLEAGVAYIDTERGHVGYRRHGGEAIHCHPRDLHGAEAKLISHWTEIGLTEPC